MKKRIAMILVTSLLLMSFSITAFASTDLEGDDDYSEVPTQGTMSPYPNIGYGSSYSQEPSGLSLLSDYGKIAMGTVSIEEISTGRLEIFASSTASKVVDEVGYTIYIQVWDGSSWNTISSNKKVNYNILRCSGYISSYVTRGKYYRAYVLSYVMDNNRYSSLVTISDYIYIK